MTDETRMATAAKTAAREGAETERRKDEAPLIRIVDDDGDLRDALLYMLSQEGWEAVAFPDAESFLRSAAPSAPGVLILDVRMPDMTGLELFAELRRRQYPQPVLFLTGHGDIEMAVEALHAGAADFLVKPVDGSKLTEAVAKALEAKRRVEMGLPDLTAMLDRWGKLTTREKEIVLCVGRGWMNKTIACEYDISIRTVEAHRASALRKLGLTTPAQIAELIAELRSRGYLPQS